MNRPDSSVPTSQKEHFARLPGFSAKVFRDAASVLGIFLTVFAVFYIGVGDTFPGWRALLPVSGAALTIVGGNDAWINRRILASRPMVFVGLISYPLYLWHWPVLTFPRIVHGAETSGAVRTAGIFLSFALAVVTWLCIERPIRFGPRKWIKTASLVAASLLIGGLGYAARRDGFAGRFPNVANDLGDLRRVEWSTAQCLKETGLAPMDYCRVASLQPPDVVLIGDSHAAVLYDGLVDGFRKRSQTLMNLGQAGCVPFYDTDTVSPGGRQSDCQPAVNRMMEFATKTASVRTIILSLRGPRYIPGVGFSPSDARAAPKKLLWTGALKNSDQAAVFKAALENTVSRLDATGKRIILVLDWPELGFDPRSCLPRPVSLFSSPKALCGVPRAQVDARNRDYRELASKLEKEFVRMKVLDPLPYLCDPTACYAMKNGRLLYSDDNHVSVAGATYLSERFFDEHGLP